MSDFKNLIVWQKSMSLTKDIYLFTEKLPPGEKFGLISQIRRCAISIPSNIAEGSKRRTRKDFRQFLKIASGSAAELETQLILVKDIYKIENKEIFSKLKEIQKMLESLIKKL
jgi:four helix bundle protein